MVGKENFKVSGKNSRINNREKEIKNLYHIHTTRIGKHTHTHTLYLNRFAVGMSATVHSSWFCRLHITFISYSVL